MRADRPLCASIRNSSCVALQHPAQACAARERRGACERRRGRWSRSCGVAPDKRLQLRQRLRRAARATSLGKSISIHGTPVTSATSNGWLRSSSRSRTASSCGRLRAAAVDIARDDAPRGAARRPHRSGRSPPTRRWCRTADPRPAACATRPARRRCTHSFTGSSPASKSRSISRRFTGLRSGDQRAMMRSSYSTSASISSTSPPRVMASADGVHGQHAAELELGVEHDLAVAAAMPADPVRPRPVRGGNRAPARPRRRPPPSACCRCRSSRRHAAEAQQALGQLLSSRLLQTQTAARPQE